MYSGWFSLGKMYCVACCGGIKKWVAIFLCRSLLLSTIVLNDMLNKSTWGVKKCEANQKHLTSRHV